MNLRHAAALALVGWYLFSPYFVLADNTGSLAPQREAAEVDLDALWNKFKSFFDSSCDGAGGHCGINDWASVIRNVALPSLPPGAHIMNPGFGDDGVDTTNVTMKVDLFCPNSNCVTGGSIPPSQIASYVSAQVLAATNGFISVQAALQSFGLSTHIDVNVNAPMQQEMMRKLRSRVAGDDPRLQGKLRHPALLPAFPE